MTSCVFSLFIIVFVCSSITVVDLADNPAGIKVRITDKGLTVFRNLGVTFLKKLVDKVFAEFAVSGKHINELKFSQIMVEQDQVSLTLQKDSGLKFEIKQLNVVGEMTYDNKKIDFDGKDLMFNVDVKLNRDQGKLAINFPNCELKADKIKPTSKGLLGAALTVLKPLLLYLFNNKICPKIKDSAPEINKLLQSVNMVTKPFEELNLNMDYSLSGDIAVTSSSLDIPIKGLVSDGNADAGLTGKEPVFREDTDMVYVGASEVFFNSAAHTLYSIGAMKKTAEVTNIFAKALLKAWQIIWQPTQLMNPLHGSVEVTEAPSISISQNDGVTIKFKANAQVMPETPTNDQKLVSITVSAICKSKVKVYSSSGYISFSSDEIRCTSESGTVMNGILNILAGKAGDFLHGLHFPLPFGLSLSTSQVKYHDGFLTVGGSMLLRLRAEELLLEKLMEMMRCMFVD